MYESVWMSNGTNFIIHLTFNKLSKRTFTDQLNRSYKIC